MVGGAAVKKDGGWEGKGWSHSETLTTLARAGYIEEEAVGEEGVDGGAFVIEAVTGNYSSENVVGGTFGSQEQSSESTERFAKIKMTNKKTFRERGS